MAAYRERTIARFDLAALADWTPPAFAERAAFLLCDPLSALAIFDGRWARPVVAAGARDAQGGVGLLLPIAAAAGLWQL